MEQGEGQRLSKDLQNNFSHAFQTSPGLAHHDQSATSSTRSLDEPVCGPLTEGSGTQNILENVSNASQAFPGLDNKINQWSLWTVRSRNQLLVTEWGSPTLEHHRETSHRHWKFSWTWWLDWIRINQRLLWPYRKRNHVCGPPTEGSGTQNILENDSNASQPSPGLDNKINKWSLWTVRSRNQLLGYRVGITNSCRIVEKLPTVTECCPGLGDCSNLPKILDLLVTHEAAGHESAGEKVQKTRGSSHKDYAHSPRLDCNGLPLTLSDISMADSVEMSRTT